MILDRTLQESKRFTGARDWLAVGFRRRRLILTSLTGIILGSILFAWSSVAHYYESSMQILVKQERADPAITSSPNSAVGPSGIVTPDQISSEVILLRGDDLLRSVAETCGLEKQSHLSDFLLPRDPAQRRTVKLAKATRNLARGLDVHSEKTANVINVTYGRTGDPEIPHCVLDNLGKLYLDKHLRLARPAGSSDFFGDEAEKYHQRLTASENRLAEFGQKEGIVAPDVQRGDMAQQVVNFVATLHHTKQAIAADIRRITSDEDQMRRVPDRSPTQRMSNSADALLQQLQSTLLAAQLKRTQLLLKFDPSYPLVKEADQEIAQTQDAIADAQKTQYVNQTTDRDPTYELLREDIAKTRANLASEEATAKELAKSIQIMQAQMVDLDQKAIKQSALVREAKADEGNYLLYLSKREQERTSDALDQKRFANVSIAVPPGVPVIPAQSPVFVVLIGCVLGVFVSISAAYVAEYLDPSFNTPADVIRILNIPILASLPLQRDGKNLLRA
jgi:uncharacterized protein involved in exopolysaccharide biosynthesis